MNPVWQPTSANFHTKQQQLAREEQLVAAAQRGSAAAFAELQSLYSQRLFNRIVRITKNREDAEDALQDTFLRAYLALGNFEGRSSFSSWLTRIAINSALMMLRKRSSRAEVFFDLPYGDWDEILGTAEKGNASNPEQAYATRQECIHLLAAIQELEPKLREAIKIHIAGECSVREIAQALDISVAAAKTRLHRARQCLVRSKSLRRYTTSGYLPQTRGVISSPSAFGIEGRHV